jgi:hypothetical protein
MIMLRAEYAHSSAFHFVDRISFLNQQTRQRKRSRIQGAEKPGECGPHVRSVLSAAREQRLR